jgi:hypothetical protein
LGGELVQEQLAQVQVVQTQPAPSVPYRVDGDTAYFPVKTLPDGTVVSEQPVAIVDGNLQFFPERSAAHREILRQLGQG